MRTHASMMDDSNTSSMPSSASLIKSRVLKMSACEEFESRLFERMEQVTWFGLRPASNISSISCQTPFRPFLVIVALMSSLYVTRFGRRPSFFICSTRPRAASKWPFARWALIRVLNETVSTNPASFVLCIHASAASKLWHSTHASITVLYATLLISTTFSFNVLNTVMAPSRSPSAARFRIMVMCFATSDGDAFKSVFARFARPHRSAEVIRARSRRASTYKCSTPLGASSEARRSSVSYKSQAASCCSEST
mmetsp:Transcript_37999/g.104495  ORF Transcript_37999/g.104495 Transcript_37999/m.104495 type:complete len:253 (-) Transcript_37999:1308-2066(-)